MPKVPETIKIFLTIFIFDFVCDKACVSYWYNFFFNFPMRDYTRYWSVVTRAKRNCLVGVIQYLCWLLDQCSVSSVAACPSGNRGRRDVVPECRSRPPLYLCAPDTPTPVSRSPPPRPRRVARLTFITTIIASANLSQ